MQEQAGPRGGGGWEEGIKRLEARMGQMCDALPNKDTPFRATATLRCMNPGFDKPEKDPGKA